MQVADTRHEGKTIGRKEARKIFESVLKASKTGAKGTHVRALMNRGVPGSISRCMALGSGLALQRPLVRRLRHLAPPLVPGTTSF